MQASDRNNMKMQGIILIFIATVLGIMCLFILLQMRETLLVDKSIRSILEQQQHCQHLEQVLKRIINNMPQHLHCFPERLNVNSMNSASCYYKINNKKLYYWVEDLGDFPCQRIGSKSSHQWQIHIEDIEHSTTMLEARYAQAIEGQKCLQDQLQIQAGLQSWRLFNP